MLPHRSFRSKPTEVSRRVHPVRHKCRKSALAGPIGNLTSIDALVALVVPLLGPAHELIKMIGDNRDSSDTKTKLETKVHSLWERALRPDHEITITDCRAVQDQILSIRQVNAHVPDWLDNFWRTRNETLMQESAAHLIEEAVRHGKTRS